MARQLLVCAALVASLLASAPARAEDKALARAAYADGLKYYDLNQFEPALHAFEKAYWNYPEPAFLFNIAQCYRQLESYDDAIKFYRSFLRKVPDAPNRAEVDQLIAKLEVLSARRAAAAAAQHKSEHPVASTTPSTTPPANATAPNGKAATREPSATPKTATAKNTTNATATNARTTATSANATNANPNPNPNASTSTTATSASADQGETRIVAQAKPRSHNLKLRNAGIGIGVAGLALVGLGGAFVGLAGSANGAYLHPGDGTYSPSADANRGTFQTLDVVSFAVGGAMTVAGVALFVAGRR